MSKSITDNNIDYGTSYQISSQSQISTLETEFIREGYELTAWNSKSDGTGDSYTLNQVLNMTQNYDLYAMWQKILGKKLILKSINGVNCYFDSSNQYILSSLKYVDKEGVVQTPYNLCSEVDIKNNLSAVSDESNTIIDVKDYGFYNCANLKYFYVPSVLSIYPNCFAGTSIQDIDIKNVLYIGHDSFDGAPLSYINIPNVKLIEEYAFYFCYNLSLIDFSERNLESIPTLNNINAFSGLPSNYQIKVPSELYDEWISANNWNNISSHIISQKPSTGTATYTPEDFSFKINQMNNAPQSNFRIDGNITYEPEEHLSKIPAFDINNANDEYYYIYGLISEYETTEMGWFKCTRAAYDYREGEYIENISSVVFSPQSVLGQNYETGKSYPSYSFKWTTV